MEVSRKDSNYLFSEITQNTLNSPEENLQKPNIISIDPFGTPNLYLDAAFKAIQRVNGLLCITATDTAVLFGVRPLSCIRKYMSKPLHTEYSKEIGARILIYFISRIANMNNMGIIPILTFYTSHFIRVIKDGGEPIYTGEEGRNLCIFAKLPYISNQNNRIAYWEEIKSENELDKSCVVEEPRDIDVRGFTRYSRNVRRDLRKGINQGLVHIDFKYEYEQ